MQDISCKKAPANTSRHNRVWELIQKVPKHTAEVRKEIVGQGISESKLSYMINHPEYILNIVDANILVCYFMDYPQLGVNSVEHLLQVEQENV